MFLGITSITASYDRVATPYGHERIPGVEVHAQLFETLERGQFLTDASPSSVLGFCVLTVILAGLIFALLNGSPAYLAAGALLIAAHASLFLFFRQGVVFPYFAPLASAWLASVAAASYQHFIVRRQLHKSESDRKRYQQAIHFVTHEMRTPLTAIQGSSELMGRYTLTEEKRKQIADMINQESKRLARIIQTFLDVERLSDGQMELKREPFSAREIVETCIQRARPLAERKNIRIQTNVLEGELQGDRELMEYAIYNLLTNAVKYSNADTEIKVWCLPQGDQLRLSVKDQGIGMDAKELRQIFQKFYRTRRAEASGEAGSGIGLSIVEQIVHHHGGKMEVTSEPGKGSCFTVVLQAYSRAADVMLLSVDCFRKHRPEDAEIPILGPGGEFESRWIHLADLKGNIQAYPESDETFPALKSQQRSVVQQLMASSDPLIQQALADPANIGFVKGVLGLSDLVVPGEDSRNKQLREIELLMHAAPIVVGTTVGARHAAGLSKLDGILRSGD